jgi:hypothetical protein
MSQISAGSNRGKPLDIDAVAEPQVVNAKTKL